MSSGESAYPVRRGAPWAARSRALVRAIPRPRPELAVLLAIAGVLNLWDLSRNGWANTYYSAAVRSMSSSWHDFLFGSFDSSGVMTIDKPPLAFWVQTVSVRLFGFHPLSLLVPEALMGMASVALVYDLTRRVWGRGAGFAAGLVLAITPITVAISRHNNPDALLILCCVGALWCTVRALGDGRTRWLVGAGACVGLGFETKMAAALLVVPAIALAWLWVAPRGRIRAVRALLAGGAVMIVVAGAWPLLVTLTPAADRPWIAGTSDNSVLSLITGYNGLGRLDGQAGGPQIRGGRGDGARASAGGAGASSGGSGASAAGPALFGSSGSAAGAAGSGGGSSGGTVPGGGGGLPGGGFAGGGPGGGGPGGGPGSAGPFGGSAGPLRLLNSSLGGQAGWLLGFAIAAAAVLLAATRLRRRDPATGWLLAVVGSFVTIAVAFSVAQGIFHPYYVSLLAPFTAALVGAGLARAIAGGLAGRVLAVAAIGAGVATELAVLHDYPGDLRSLPTVLLVAGGLAAATLAIVGAGRVRVTAMVVGLGALLIAPAVWSAQTLGYATSTTFPAGGPESLSAGGAGGAFGAPGGFAAAFRGARGGFGPVTGAGAATAGAGFAPGPPGGGFAGGPAGGGGFGGGGFGGGGFGGGQDSGLTQALSYAAAHGGGTVAVSSQSGAAATAILASNADVAGIGGFSGQESEVTPAWLAGEVREGRIRWVLDDGVGGFGGPTGVGGGDTRVGARMVLAAVAKACRAVTLPTQSASGPTLGGNGGAGGAGALYDCRGRAAALQAS